MASTSSGSVRGGLKRSIRTTFLVSGSFDKKTNRPKKNYRSASRSISACYGIGRTESEKAFVVTLNKYGDFSLRLLVIYIFSVWIIGVVMSVIVYFPMENDIIVRCKIPALEKCFNFSQVLNISVKNKLPTIDGHDSTQYCKYDVRNYAELIQRYGCNYSAIMNELNSTSVNQTTRPCEQFIVYDRKLLTKINDKINPRTYYQWYCDQNNWYNVFQHLDEHSVLWVTVLLLPFADLYGRKRAFVFSSILYWTGCFIMILPSQWCLFIGIIIRSLRIIVFTSLYVLVLEMCSDSVVSWLGALMSAIHATGVTMTLILNFNIKNWIYKELAEIIMLLVLPFGIWYIEESPRWLMFSGCKSDAWKILMEWETDVQPNGNDLDTPITEKQKLKKLLQFLNKPLFRKRLAIFCLFCFFYHISKYNVGRVSRTCYDRDHSLFYIIVNIYQIILVVLMNILAAVHGKKRTLFLLYCISVPLNVITFMQHRNLSSVGVLQFLVRTIDSFKIAEYFIILFYAAGIFPTPYRVTAINFCLASNLVGLVINNHLENLFRPNSMGLTYMPILLASAACMLIIYFLPETHNMGLPDTPLDALVATSVSQ